MMLLGVTAMGQVKFEQSQSRIIEPKQNVFIVPLVAEIEILENQKRQDYGSYEFAISSIETLTYQMLENFKANALYRAAREADADLIVAATFKVISDEKGKKLFIDVSGFPGRYKNFRSADLEKEEYKWIPVIYPPEGHKDTVEKTKALTGN